MIRSNIFRVLMFFLVVCLLIGLNFSAELRSQNFKLFTDGLDSFGGRASSANFSERIGSGGQPGVVGTSQGTSFYGLQGYVNTAAFQHGDANADGNVTIADVVYLINYFFKSGADPIPMETGDVDGDNLSQIQDAVYLVIYLFKGGNPPVNL
ncbi:MAG: dockerin type I domain-containing protein [Candidatus Zixiibacteriota bacterium]